MELNSDLARSGTLSLSLSHFLFVSSLVKTASIFCTDLGFYISKYIEQICSSFIDLFKWILFDE